MGSKKEQADTYHHGNLRRSLLEAAMGILEAENVEALSLRRLARAVGVSHNAPYMHFSEKEAVLAALAQEGWRLLAAALEEGLRKMAEEKASWMTRFESVCRTYVTFVLGHRGHSQIMFRPYSSQDYPEANTAAIDALEILEGVIREGQDAGQLRRASVREIATVTWTLLHGIATILANEKMPTVGEESLDVDLLVSRFAGYLLSGIAGDAATE